MGNTGDLGILLCHALHGVDHHQDHIGPLHCRDSTDDAVTLQFLFDFILPPEAGCINKYIFLSIVDDLGINGISGGTCHIGNNHSLLSQKLVYD